MDYKDSIEPVTVLKTKSAELIRKARETGQPIVITQNGKATAVLQDVETYQRQRRALLLLKYLSQADQEIRDGKGVPDSKVPRHFDRKLIELQGE